MPSETQIRAVVPSPSADGYAAVSPDREQQRAHKTFGTREITRQEFGDLSIEDQQMVLEAQKKGPVVSTAVPHASRIRQGLLPVYWREASSRNSWINKYKLGRMLHFFFAAVQGAFGTDVNQRVNTRLIVPGGQPFSQTLRQIFSYRAPIDNGFGNQDMPPRPAAKTIEASDRDLAKALGYFTLREGRAYAVPEHRTADASHAGDGIFGSEAPKLSDIRQADHRATCYFLGTLAAVLAKPDGAERIQSIMKDNGDGTVTVRFRDRDVRVTKDRLVDARGNNLFNAGAPWVRIMEKAYLAYHMSTVVGDDIAGGADTYRDTAKMVDNTFDHNNPIVGHAALEHLLEPDVADVARIDKNRAAGAVTDKFVGLKAGERVNKNEAPQTNETIYATVDKTIRDGGIAYAGTHGVTGFFHRILPGHIYAIVGTGERERYDNHDKLIGTEKGYWVYDPYGASIGGLREGNVGTGDDDASPTEIAVATRGQDALFFVSVGQAGELFSEFAVAGQDLGLVRIADNADQQSDEADSASGSGADIEDNWEEVNVD